MTDYPDNIAFIARLREEGVPEKEIATRIGINRKTLWGRVHRWNAQNPNNPLPRPKSRPETPKYVQVANMYTSGVPQEEIAECLGIKVCTVEGHLCLARKHGMRTRAPKQREGDPAEHYTYLRRKGAAPPRGDVGHILSTLTIAQVDVLLRDLKPTDKTLADLLARILKEHLDEKVPSGG